MRYPRILTCSSARPRYRSCPSAPHSTRSPVRYIRCPGAPAPANGHATNRDPVNGPRRQYPHPTKRPATYNSPTTPAGTGRNQPSNTNNAAPDIGDPIGGTPAPPPTGYPIVTSTVVSVGPYSLTSVATAAYRSTSSAAQTSPPVISVRPHSCSAGRAASVLGVNLACDTCWRASRSVNSLPGNACSSVGITAAAPVNNAHHIFPTDISKINGANCKTRLPGVIPKRSA